MVYRSYGYIIDEFGDKERRFKQPTMVVDGWESKYDIPAWSMHRLWELDRIHDITLDSEDEIATLYDEVINNIEAQIKEGYFNKEYLV